MSVGRDLKAKANAELDKVLADVEAARENVADAGKVGITGFCWGGFIVDGCLPFECGCAAYYGGIIDYNDEELKCPTIAHWPEDASIPMADVEVIEAGHPSAEIFVYEADHGFHCDQRGLTRALQISRDADDRPLMISWPVED